jgi:hypothetical protein
MPPAIENIEPGSLPLGLESRSLRRHALQIAAVLVIVGVVAALAPAFGDLRRRLLGAHPLAGRRARPRAALVPPDVLMFRPLFCARMSLRTSYRLGMSSWRSARWCRRAVRLDRPPVPGRCASAAWPCTTWLAARWRPLPESAVNFAFARSSCCDRRSHNDGRRRARTLARRRPAEDPRQLIELFGTERGSRVEILASFPPQR